MKPLNMINKFLGTDPFALLIVALYAGEKVQQVKREQIVDL